MIHRVMYIPLMPTYASLIDKLAAAEMDVSQTDVTDVASICGTPVYCNSITRFRAMSDLFYIN